MKRKIDATNGTSYTYRFADGSKCSLKAGQNEITEEMIMALKRADNAEYNNNLKNWGPIPSKEEKAEWEKKNPGIPYPRKWNASLDYQYEQENNEIEKTLYHSMESSNQDSSFESLYDAIDQLAPKQKKIIQLFLQGMTQSQIAREMGISTSTVRDQFNAAKKNIKKTLS